MSIWLHRCHGVMVFYSAEFFNFAFFDRKKVTWGHQRDSEWLKEQLKKQHWQALGHEAFWTNGPPSCFCWSLPMICHILVPWHGQKLLNISEYLAIHNKKLILFALFSTTGFHIDLWIFVLKFCKVATASLDHLPKHQKMLADGRGDIIHYHPMPNSVFFVFTQELKLDFEGFSSAEQHEIITGFVFAGEKLRRSLGGDIAGKFQPFHGANLCHLDRC